jgi:hypothetical protein
LFSCLPIMARRGRIEKMSKFEYEQFSPGDAGGYISFYAALQCNLIIRAERMGISSIQGTFHHRWSLSPCARSASVRVEVEFNE